MYDSIFLIRWFRSAIRSLRRWIYRHKRLSASTASTFANPRPLYFSPESTLTLEKMKAAIYGIDPPLYDNLVISPGYADLFKIFASANPGPGPDSIMFGGMKITPSQYMPENRMLAVGTTCHYCNRSTHSPVPCSDGRMMHQPKMIIFVLEEEHDKKDKP